MSLREEVEALLTKREMSQSELASKLGMQQPDVNAFLRGKRGLPLHHLDNMLSVLGVTEAHKKHLRVLWHASQAPKAVERDVRAGYSALIFKSSIALAVDILIGNLEFLTEVLPAEPLRLAASIHLRQILDALHKLGAVGDEKLMDVREQLTRAQDPGDFWRACAYIAPCFSAVESRTENDGPFHELIEAIRPAEAGKCARMALQMWQQQAGDDPRKLLEMAEAYAASHARATEQLEALQRSR